MKLKKTWICSTLLVTLILTACGTEPETSSNTSVDNQVIAPEGNTVTTETNYEQNAEPSNGTAYASDIMSLLMLYDEFQGQIKDILPTNGNDYVCTSEGIFKDGEKLFVPSQPVTELIGLSQGALESFIFTHNEDGTYSVYYEYMNEEQIYTAVEKVSGLTSKPIYAINDFLGSCFVYLQDETESYFNCFNFDEQGQVVDTVEASPIEVLGDAAALISENPIQLISEAYVLLSDNSMHPITSGISTSLNRIAVYSNTNNIPNVSRIIPPSPGFSYNNPLFQEVGDSSNLYLYTSNLKNNEYDEQYKVCIPLPDGYTTDMIQNVLFDEDLLIEFNTGDIYFSKEDSINDLQLQEKLSALNKEGKIQKLFRNRLHFCALMDDSCAYELLLF